MTRDDIAKERALKMHDLALSVLRVKGTVRAILHSTAQRFQAAFFSAGPALAASSRHAARRLQDQRKSGPWLLQA